VSRTTARLIPLFAIVLGIACDKVPLTAPIDSEIFLSINTTTLPINGTTEIVATVVEPAGTAVHNGTTVSFSASMGVVEPREARTENGIARAIFRSGTQSGTAKITAFSGGARSEEVEVLVGGAAAERVTVRTEPSTVPVTGGSVQVIAVVVDLSGNALPGAPVIFTADNGTLSSNSGVTDENGQARTTLTTNRETIVRASVAGKEAQTTIRTVSLPAVNITASANPIVGLPVTFTISAAGGANANPIADVSIDFGDGTPPQRLGPVPATGQIQTSHIYRSSGSYSVRATATDSTGVRGDTSVVVSVQRVVPQVTVTASPSSTSAGQAVSATVSVSNAQNIPVDSVTLSWGDGTQTSLGSLQSGSTSASKVYLQPGIYTIRADLRDANGGSSSGATQVTVLGREAIDVDFSYVPQSIFSPSTVFTVTLPATNTGIASYTWFFGDGSFQTTTSRRIEHRYSSSGNYDVVLRVTTTSGGVFESGPKRVVIP
jgi:PKD repeat protein